MEYTNAPVKGQLKIYKQGEVLKGFDKDFQYEMTGLSDAKFEVYTLKQEISVMKWIRWRMNNFWQN